MENLRGGSPYSPTIARDRGVQPLMAMWAKTPKLLVQIYVPLSLPECFGDKVQKTTDASSSIRDTFYAGKVRKLDQRFP